MIEISIPNRKTFIFTDLVLDFNGTLAIDGIVISGIINLLERLSQNVHIHILTADTFGTVHDSFSLFPDFSIHIIHPGEQSEQKQRYIDELGTEGVIAIGNGNNDRSMLKQAGLGIALIQSEGAATISLLNSDLVFMNITDALQTLLKPKRLIATLRD